MTGMASDVKEFDVNRLRRGQDFVPIVIFF